MAGLPRRAVVTIIVALFPAVGCQSSSDGDEPATSTDPAVRSEEQDRPDPPTAPSIAEPIAAAPDPIELGTPQAIEISGLPLTDIVVSPTAAWVADNTGDEICLYSTTNATAHRCLDVTGPDSDFQGSIGQGSLAWSPDESTIAFHENAFQLAQEPDIAAIDVRTGTVTILTDDGVGSFVDPDERDRADIDVAPFFGPAGELSFFRLDGDGVNARLMEAGDGDEPTEVLTVDGIPFAARPEPDGPLVAVGLARADDPGGLLIIDPTEGSSTMIPGDAALSPTSAVIDVAGGRMLVPQVSPDASERGRVGLIDLSDPARAEAVPTSLAADSRSVTGSGLSPDGTQIAMILEDRDNPSGHHLVVAPILDDGSIGEFGVIATGPEFAPNGGDVTVRPAGLGWPREIVWTDARLIYALGPDQIVSLPIATP